MRVFRREGQIAGSHELAPGRGRDALHLGDHRLRDGLDTGHQLGADIEKAAVFVDIAPDHFGEVVAGGEDFTRRGQDDDAKFAAGADRGEAVDEFPHQGQGKRIAPLRAVQRDYRYVALGREADVLRV